MRCKILFDNTVLNICIQDVKKYTLSDNMCLVHISAIVMLTVMCADRMYMQS